MPHLKIEYTANLDAHFDKEALCSTLFDALIALRDAGGAPVFPLLGTRVLAYPSAAHAVAAGGRAFVYLNLRVTTGRSPELIKAIGDATLAAAQAFLAPAMAAVPTRLTLHIDDTLPIYEGKLSTSH
ncbi:5-carboxymethyl-2-hydroxymuconate isomerase [Oxalobacteraceae bacterium A2-2]